MRRSAITCLALAACTVEAAPVPSRVRLAEVGIESSSLDRSVDPCVDFYQFACGGWLRTNELPGDRGRWSRHAEVEERTKIAIRALLEDAAKGIGGDASTKKLGDFYASCMDEGAIESGGTAALRPLLVTITKVRDPRSWLAAIAALHQLGVAAVWRETVVGDGKLSVPAIAPSGLGLGHRAFYVAPELKDKLDAYRAHVARTLALVTPAAKPAVTDAAAADVIAIETELAQATTRAAPIITVSTDATTLGKVMKIDWKAYWRATAQDPGKTLVVHDAPYFAAVDKLRTSFKPGQWRSYFTYQAVSVYSFGLPKVFDAQRFELDAILAGLTQPAERSKRCITATQDALGDVLGQAYVARYFPASARQSAISIYDSVAKAAGTGTAGMVGYPDRWRIDDFAIRRDDFAGNRLRAEAAIVHRAIARIGKPFDRTTWSQHAFDVVAAFDPRGNTVAVPAGLLQSPLFGTERGVAANFGSLGSIVGHELAYATDAPAERMQCLAEQLVTFEAAPGQFLDGNRLAREAVADLDGTRAAFAAYRAAHKDAVARLVADGFTEDQQFFLSLGQASCSKDRSIDLRSRLATDDAAPPKFRVYGTLRNMREFSTAFRCAAGTPMNPAKVCSAVSQ